MPEYKFSWEKCVCGQKLPGKPVELQGMRGGIPVGLCPKCGTGYPLVEIEPEPEPEPEAEVEPPAPDPELETPPEE